MGFDDTKIIPKQHSTESMKSWEGAVQLNVGDKPFQINKYGKHFSIGDISFSPGPTAANVISDYYVAKHFGFELITNSVTSILSPLLTDLKDCALNTSSAQTIICDNIPNFQFENGPYHPIIEDLRSESLIKSFRKKIDEVTLNKSTREILLLRQEMEKSMDRYLYELILKTMDKKQVFKSICTSIVGQIPVIGNISGGLEGGLNVLNNIVVRNEAGWIGFVAKAKLTLD